MNRHGSATGTWHVHYSLIHNGQPSGIVGVMVDGKWLMRAGRVQTIEEAEVVRQAEEVGHLVWRRLIDKYPNVPFPVGLPPGPLS